MSEEFSDDFVIEEEESSNRSFLIAAGSLIVVFILLAACLLAYVVQQQNADRDAVSEIEDQNATTEAQNRLVTQTVEALETQAALPTDTPEPEPTVEPPPTNTPIPEPTEVVQQPVEPEAAEPTSSPTAELVVGGDGSGDGTGGAPTPITPGAGETLPQTGASTWVIAIAGFALIAVLIVARRLRMS